MRLRNAVAASVLVLVVACLAQAGVTSVTASIVDKGAILPTRVTNDLKIDFTGNVRGQQMILSLTAGSVFQRTIVGSNTPPDADAFVDFPDAPYDTFVAMGGLTVQTSPDIIVVGGAVDITPGSSLLFNTTGLNVAWAPGTGVDVANMNGFTTARITLSNDAAGTLQYFGSTSAGTGDPLTKSFNVVNGVIQEIGGVTVNDLALPANTVLNATVNGTVTGTGVTTWSPTLEFVSYTPNYGAPNDPAYVPALAATFNPANQAFSWNTAGSRRGDYVWRATGSAGASSDTGLITIAQQAVPEPASLALLGLAAVGCVGIARRR